MSLSNWQFDMMSPEHLTHQTARLITAAAVVMNCFVAFPAFAEQLQGLTLQQAGSRAQECLARTEIITGMSVRVVGQTVLFDLVIEPNPKQTPWVIQLNLQSAAWNKAKRDYNKAGYDLAVWRSVVLGRRTLYSGVWIEKSGAAKTLKLPDTEHPVSGEPVPEFSAVDDLIAGFLLEHNVAGATVAVAKDGELVYSRGFGWADISKKLPMQPDSRLRIASISKPITAIAVMKLIDDGKLDPDARVVPILQKSRFRPPSDDRWNEITVRHLLQHTAGWQRDGHPDPMFRAETARQVLKLKRNVKPRDMVAWQLQEPLHFAPGTRHSYSNSGYCVLGRVIEAVGRQDYDKFVMEHVFKAAGVTNTMLGRTRLRNRHEQEVVYYMQNEPGATAFWSAIPRRGRRAKPERVNRPDGAWNLEVMDSHGGWVSTAADLVRLTSAVFDRQPSLLSPESRDLMLSRPSVAGPDQRVWYGCGWQVRSVGDRGFNVWHSGALDGTSTLLVRRWDGYSWAVLFNTDKSSNGRRLSSLIDPLMHPVMP